MDNPTFSNSVLNRKLMDGKKAKCKQGAQPKFSESNDLKLKALVEQHGTFSWSLIAKNFKNKSAKQCKDRWFNYLSPDIRRDPWEPHEDKMLEDLVKQLGTAWKKIAPHLDRRSPGDIRFRYLKLQRHKKKHNSALMKCINNKAARIIAPDNYLAKVENKDVEQSSNESEIIWNIFDESFEGRGTDFKVFDMVCSSYPEEFYVF